MNLFIGASLISSFIAGMIALFAPCCISFLLPAYLGSVFKERKQVFLMTIVFSLGIFIVIFPVVLGFKFLSSLLTQYHNQTFLLGGLSMFVVGTLAFLGIKLPMPSFAGKQIGNEKPDVLSVFTLGIFSGITSSCCAPVLLGVLSLSFLSPSFWLGTLIAFTYVLGMVAPLYFSAYFVDTQKVLRAEFFNRHLGNLTLAKREYSIKMSNLLSALIFIPMGLLTIYLTLTNRLQMQQQAQQFGNWVGKLTIRINAIVGNSAFIQILFVLAIIILMIWLFLRWRWRRNQPQQP